MPMPLTTARPCFMSFLPAGDLFQVLEVLLLLDFVFLGNGFEFRVDDPEHHQKKDYARSEKQKTIPPQQQAQGSPDHKQDIDQRRNDKRDVVFLGPAVGLDGRPATLYQAHLIFLLSPARPPGQLGRASPPRAGRVSTSPAAAT